MAIAGNQCEIQGLGQIHHGDCVAWLRGLPAGSVDLAFADPPFNIGYEYDVYRDRQEDESYLAWCGQWMEGLHRVLKDDGTFWLAIGDEYAAELKLEAQRIGSSVAVGSSGTTRSASTANTSSAGHTLTCSIS
jgi:DNA modification methylase